MTTAFGNLDHDVRMSLRNAITSNGGQVAGYEGTCVVIYLPNPSTPFIQAMQKQGLVMPDPNDLWYMPITAPENDQKILHDGFYPGSKGFYLSARFHFVPLAVPTGWDSV